MEKMVNDLKEKWGSDENEKFAQLLPKGAKQ